MWCNRRNYAKSFPEEQLGLTGDSQVCVGLNLSCQIPGKALEHPGVIRQKAIDLQAASHQHPVPGHLYWVNGQSILVPHNVWLRHSCSRWMRVGFNDTKSVSSFLNTKWIQFKRVLIIVQHFWQGWLTGLWHPCTNTTVLTSCLTGNIHHLLHLSSYVFLWFFYKLWWLWGKWRKGQTEDEVIKRPTCRCSRNSSPSIWKRRKLYILKRISDSLCKEWDCIIKLLNCKYSLIKKVLISGEANLS